MFDDLVELDFVVVVCDDGWVLLCDVLVGFDDMCGVNLLCFWMCWFGLLGVLVVWFVNMMW